jgi:hypothetical protein
MGCKMRKILAAKKMYALLKSAVNIAIF